MIKHSRELIFEYSRITPQIYIGTNQCCKTHFDRALINKGIHADISLEEKRLDAPFGVKYYLWLPVKDHYAPTKKQFRAGIAFLDKLIDQGEKIYIHCEHGHGRAPTFVAAYFIYKGMEVDGAIRYIKKKRPSIHINKRQREALKKFHGNSVDRID